MANADNSTENTANNDYTPSEGSCACGEKSAESVNRDDKHKAFAESYTDGEKSEGLANNTEFAKARVKVVSFLFDPRCNSKTFAQKIVDFLYDTTELRKLDPIKYDKVVEMFDKISGLMQQLEQYGVALKNQRMNQRMNEQMRYAMEDARIHQQLKDYMFNRTKQQLNNSFEYELEITPRKLLRAAVVGLGVYYAYRLWKRRR